MPDENDLRRMLGAADAPNTIDTARVLARSRRRRLPAQFAAGTAGALVIAGVFVVGAQLAQPSQEQAASTMSDSADSAESPEASELSAGSGMQYDTDADGIKRAPAEKINLCTGTLADVAPAESGLQLDLEFPRAATAGVGAVEGTVLLTNTSSSPVTGLTAAVPAITLSQEGIVLWHSNGPVDLSAVVVDLAPGETLSYPASFTPVRCDVTDDMGESFRPDLPAVAAGDYQLSALIDFMPDGVSALELVSGPPEVITLQ